MSIGRDIGLPKIPCFNLCSLSFSATDRPFGTLEEGTGSVGDAAAEFEREDIGGGARDGKKEGAWMRACDDANA